MAQKSTAGGAIDATTFRALQTTTGEDFVLELVHAFLADTPPLLAALRSARATGDTSGFRRAAHSLKSNGNTFGAFAFSALARELEETGLPALGERATELLDRLEAAYAAADNELRALCHG